MSNLLLLVLLAIVAVMSANDPSWLHGVIFGLFVAAVIVEYRDRRSA